MHRPSPVSTSLPSASCQPLSCPLPSCQPSAVTVPLLPPPLWCHLPSCQLPSHQLSPVSSSQVPASAPSPPGSLSPARRALRGTSRPCLPSLTHLTASGLWLFLKGTSRSPDPLPSGLRWDPPQVSFSLRRPLVASPWRIAPQVAPRLTDSGGRRDWQSRPSRPRPLTKPRLPTQSRPLNAPPPRSRFRPGSPAPPPTLRPSRSTTELAGRAPDPPSPRSDWLRGHLPIAFSGLQRRRPSWAGGWSGCGAQAEGHRERVAVMTEGT